MDKTDDLFENNGADISAIKVSLEGDELDPWGFDRDNGGGGSAQRVVGRLRFHKCVLVLTSPK